VDCTRHDILSGGVLGGDDGKGGGGLHGLLTSVSLAERHPNKLFYHVRDGCSRA
jgi:hypothetical protein